MDNLDSMTRNYPVKFFWWLWDSGAWILPVIGVVSFCCVAWPAQTIGCFYLLMAGLMAWAMVVFYQNELRGSGVARPSRRKASMQMTDLENTLITHAQSYLAKTYPDADPRWIAGAARLKVLGDRAELPDQERRACQAILALVEFKPSRDRPND